HVPNGSGSGLNADLLDGNDSAAFASASHSHAAADVVSGVLALARIPILDLGHVPNGSGSGLNAHYLDGVASPALAQAATLSTPGTINAAANPVDWTKLKNVPPVTLP